MHSASSGWVRSEFLVRRLLSRAESKLINVMRKPKTPPVSFDNADSIEVAFYEALQRGDIDRLMACWGDDDDMVCVHPGYAWVVGPIAIRHAFDAIFSDGSIRVQAVKVRKLDTFSASVHSVLERVEVLTDEGVGCVYVIATNVYHQTAQGWRMVAHHASPVILHELHEVPETPLILH